MSDGTTGHAWEKLADARAECVRLSARVAALESSLALADRQVSNMAAVLREAVEHINDDAVVRKVNAVTDGI